MFGIPSAQLRWVVARVPGPNLGVEMVEAKDIERKPVNPRPQDPGSMTLVLIVRDIDKAFAPLKAAGVPVVTPGGAPLTFGANNARGVIVRDPDGHFVELLQPSPLPETIAPAESNIIDARVRITVADTDRAMQLYRDSFSSSRRWVLRHDSAAGSDGAEGLAGSTDDGTGAGLGAEDGVCRDQRCGTFADSSAHSGSGATRLQIRVKDLDSTIDKLKASGSSVVSAGGAPVSLQGGYGPPSCPIPTGCISC